VRRIHASCWRTALGVKRRETRPRCSAWCGSSWAIMLLSPGEKNDRYPRLLTKTSLRRSTSWTSAWRVMPQRSLAVSR
jgi:hypothetical protein